MPTEGGSGLICPQKVSHSVSGMRLMAIFSLYETCVHQDIPVSVLIGMVRVIEEGQSFSPWVPTIISCSGQQHPV